MESIDLLRFAALCILLAGAETLHGIARAVLLAPRIGKVRAIKFSVVTGTLIAFGLCYVFVFPASAPQASPRTCSWVWAYPA